MHTLTLTTERIEGYIIALRVMADQSAHPCDREYFTILANELNRAIGQQ
jgi:hypothetical protein